MQAAPSHQSPHMCSRSDTCARSLHLEGVSPSRLASLPLINSFGSGCFQACVCLRMFNLHLLMVKEGERGLLNRSRPCAVSLLLLVLGAGLLL